MDNLDEGDIKYKLTNSNYSFKQMQMQIQVQNTRYSAKKKKNYKI